MSTLFDKIIDRTIPADIVYEDEICLAFRDIHPQAPIHCLIIPKKAIAKLSDATPDDASILGHLMTKVGVVADQVCPNQDFRVVINNGADAGQTVFHLHLHLLAGRPLQWPPG